MHMKKFLRNWDNIKDWLLIQKKKISVAALSVGLISILFFLPFVSFSMGNLLFGGFEPLYNVRMAHAAFFIAAHPLIQEKPPRYAHYQLSRTYFIQGRHEEALEEVRKELEVYPDDVNAYYLLGLTYGYLGRTHEGIEAFSKYIETHPGTWAGRNDKAWLQFRVGDIEGALLTMEPIVAQFPLTPWVQNTYCSLLTNTDRLEQALEVCRRAKEIIDKMTPEDWGHAYPGNDPRIYSEGLDAMRKSIDHNLSIIEDKVQ
jgi:tetratricopeptide (TPR) repeat protein